MRLILMNYGLDISANHDDKYDFVISIASGNFNYDQIKKWIKDHMIEK